MIDDNVRHEIALWGPTGSGKTWLMMSFGKALFDLKDPEFEYRLLDPESHPVNALEPPAQKPTEEMRDEVWLFQRIGRQRTPAHDLSVHTHFINLHDFKGIDTVELTKREVVRSIEESHHVILLLDPFLLANTKLADPQEALANRIPGMESTTKGQYTQNQYATHVANLLDLLGRHNRPDRYIAVCFTKIDLLGVQGRDPWQLIDAYFGAAMHTQLKNYAAQIKSSGHEQMQAFCVSAAGYLDGPERKSNYDPATGHLLVPDQWQPFRVEAPFFWIFDNIERQRLAHKGGGVTRFLFGNERLKKYIPYPVRRA
jgi:GTPase SAR1 family protein